MLQPGEPFPSEDEYETTTLRSSSGSSSSSSTGSTSAPPLPSNSTSADVDAESQRKSLSPGVIAGIVIGAVLILVLVVALVVMSKKLRKALASGKVPSDSVESGTPPKAPAHPPSTLSATPSAHPISAVMAPLTGTAPSSYSRDSNPHEPNGRMSHVQYQPISELDHVPRAGHTPTMSVGTVDGSAAQTRSPPPGPAAEQYPLSMSSSASMISDGGPTRFSVNSGYSTAPGAYISPPPAIAELYTPSAGDRLSSNHGADGTASVAKDALAHDRPDAVPIVSQ